MGERVQRGRHQLEVGERVLQGGQVEQALEAFEEALACFRGPDLRLGEAHALRGLAQVHLRGGHTERGVDYAQRAQLAYRDLSAELSRVATPDEEAAFSTSAREGLAHALVIGSDGLVRLGRVAQAETALYEAADLFDALGALPSSAAVRAAVGRLAMRAGRYADAREVLGQALELHDRVENAVGEVDILLTLAELDRLDNDIQAGEARLNCALVIAQSSKQTHLQARVHRALGALMVRAGNLEEARRSYEDALLEVREVADLELEGFTLLGLGEVLSRLGEASALDCLVDGGRLLARFQHQHGVAASMFQLAEHGVRVGEPAFALVAAECARRLWLRADPRGVGQALRMEVKALAGLRRYRDALLVAHTRAEYVGVEQPNAVAVRDYYRTRAPGHWWTDLKDIHRDDLPQAVSDAVKRVLAPIFHEVQLPHASMDTVSGAVELIEALAGRLPQSAPAVDDLPESDASLSGVWDLFVPTDDETGLFEAADEPSETTDADGVSEPVRIQVGPPGKDV